MEKPLPTKDEESRIAALNRYDILDTDFEKTFDDIAKIASQLCDTPIALISLVDPDRQWFKAACGLSARETPRDLAFCAHAIHSQDPLIVSDTLEDQRFHDNPLVIGDPKIRFYAGAPLITNDGFALGTLCAIDQKPRQLTEEQIEGLEALAQQVSINLELRLKTKTLVNLNESKNRLFSIISHDMRSPLYALNSIVEKLNEGAKTMSEAELLKWLGYAKTSTSTTIVIAENLLKWARFEDGNFHFDPVEIELSEFFTSILPILEQNAQSKSISFEVSIEENTKVIADKTMLHSIVQNLASNAVKFSPREKTISLSAFDDGNQVNIVISDTGLGMNPVVLENLFNIEKTYSTEGTDGEKGSGLGLVLCKQFAEKMGGDLAVESKLGEGTSVKLTLPRI